MALFNRFILSANWGCNTDSVSKCTDDCDSSSSETTTAVNTDAVLIHHVVTHAS